MDIFGLHIGRSKGAEPIIATKPQFTINAAQGPLTGWFQNYYLRKVSGDFYEALREGIPIIDAAIRRLISLNGTIKIIGDNAALVKELEDFCLNVPVNDTQTGIHAYLENFTNETFEQGFSLSEYIATPDMKDIAALRVADSKDIIYRRNLDGVAEPWYRFRGSPSNLNRNIYTSPTTLVDRIINATYGQTFYINGIWEEKIDPANKLYFSINNENTDPYGVSIMRSMEFCAKLLMTMQNSTGNVWERFGDPSLFVKYKTTKRDLTGTDLEARRQKIQTDVSNAFRSKRQGKSSDFVAAVNSDADMEITVIGADNHILQLDVPAAHVLEQIISKTGLPGWMLGITSRTVQGMATLEIESALQDAKIRQLAMLPGLIRLLSVVLRIRGRSWKTITTDPAKPGDWGIVFETPNLRDMVAQAQARFLNAQADQMGSAPKQQETVTIPPPKKEAHCSCGKDHLAAAGKKIGTKESRPFPWPALDDVETGYETRLKSDWEDLRQRVFTICKLTDADIALGMTKGQKDESFTFSDEQRAMVMKSLNEFIGEYDLSAEDSPVTWYYGQAYSLGLIQAARMVGEQRPILDILKNSEIFDELAKNGFQLVKDNATTAITDRIITEMQAHIIAGSNPLSVASRLNQKFGDQNSSWERLARTEMAGAAERAKTEEWKAQKITKVDFVPAPDACPICTSLAATYDIAACPSIPVHPRCRCATRPAAAETQNQ